MGEEEIVEEFAQLHKSVSRSKTARLRDLYDHIEALRSRGFSHATIVKAMKKHGLEFDLKTFEVTFYRIKRERAKRLTQLSGMPSGAMLEELIKNERKATQEAQESSETIGKKVTKPATQEELKAIARSHIDPNQFIDE
jgi:hypothetical protein